MLARTYQKRKVPTTTETLPLPTCVLTDHTSEGSYGRPSYSVLETKFTSVIYTFCQPNTSVTRKKKQKTLPNYTINLTQDFGKTEHSCVSPILKGK